MKPRRMSTLNVLAMLAAITVLGGLGFVMLMVVFQLIADYGWDAP